MRLKNIKINEISLVDKAANGLAFALMKRDESEGMSDVDAKALRLLELASKIIASDNPSEEDLLRSGEAIVTAARLVLS